MLREPRPGDLGWVVARHAELYAEEYGWGENFEGICAQIVADFANKFDPSASAAGSPRWTAATSAACFWSRIPDTVARLRLLLVDPAARGRGLGKRLTDECVRFARERGYQQHHALDPPGADRRPPRLCRRGLPPHLKRGAQELRPGCGQRVSGICASAVRSRARVGQPTPSRPWPSRGAWSRRAAASARRNCTAGSGSRAGAPGSRPRRRGRRRASPAGRR